MLYLIFVAVSSYRTAVDNALLKLAEGGKLLELKNRWWKPAEKRCTVGVTVSAVIAYPSTDYKKQKHILYLKKVVGLSFVI